MEKKLRYGLIGVGNMGYAHALYLTAGDIPNAELIAACDIKQERLDMVRELSADVKLYTDYHELLNCGEIDAVIIATPHYLHPIIGMEAFDAGLHVLSEKPIGVYTKIVREFMEKAKNSGKKFGVMFNQRTNPYFQKMREIVQSGELGELKRCVWIITDWYRTQAYYNSGGWRATWSGEGGGVLLNQCPHNLDLWQWIFGMPCRIRAFLSFGKYHDIEVEDDVTAYAEYPNGATGVFITTTGEYPGTNRLEISGTKGKLVFENDKLTFTKLLEDEKTVRFESEASFVTIPSEVIDIPCEYAMLPQHKGILQNFASAVLNDTPLLAPGYEGINGLSISNAMHLSSWKGDWVELPNDGEEFYAELEKRIATSRAKTNVKETVSSLSGSFKG